jgi:Phosphodiester glycosidase
MWILLPLALAASPWISLQEGCEYRTYEIEKAQLHVVRVNPKLVQFGFGIASEDKVQNKTPLEWLKSKKYVVAINAGMYAKDYATNVGALKSKKFANNPKFNGEYQSVFLFSPKDKNLPRAQLVDKDDKDFEILSGRYESHVQNLRLIKSNGISVWKPNGKKWSEAALAQDASGNIVFLFSREPLEMATWIEAVLKTDLQIVRAMHLDGGPPAGFSVKSKTLQIDLAGESESFFPFGSVNTGQLPIPNVIGVLRQ